jgi:hypothetical protein
VGTNIIVSTTTLVEMKESSIFVLAHFRSGTHQAQVFVALETLQINLFWSRGHQNLVVLRLGKSGSAHVEPGPGAVHAPAVEQAAVAVEPMVGPDIDEVSGHRKQAD